MISSQRGLTAYTRTRSCALSAAARNRPPYCIRGVAPTIAMERGLSIMWIDAIWLSVQNSMPPPEKALLAIKENGSWVVEPTNHEPPRGTARRPFDQPALHAILSRHRVPRVGRDLNQMAIRGIPGLAEIELVLAEPERDALARCGGARIGLPPEAERALVP